MTQNNSQKSETSMSTSPDPMQALIQMIRQQIKEDRERRRLQAEEDKRRDERYEAE